MRYFFAIVIMGAGFWYWMQPRDGNIFTGTGGNTMSSAEKVYYIQIFNHAMSYVHDGQTYAWESYNSKGTFNPTVTYTSKSKSTCRRYKEAFTIGQYSGQQEGITCKRQGKVGWCRLVAGNAETCAMENKNLTLTFGGLDVGRVDMSGMKLGSVNVSVPETGGIGRVGTPDVPDAPKSSFDFLPKGREDGQTTAGWLIQ